MFKTIMIKIIENNKNFLKFNIKGQESKETKETKCLSKPIDNAFCNSLRRSMITDVKTYAIEIVSIIKNNTILIDEIFAHRLGLIPIKILNYKEFDVKKHIIKLNAKYDEKLTDIYDIQNIYTSDLEYDRSIMYIDPNILIIKLLRDQEVSLDAILTEGTGYEHAKWSPVSATSFSENDDGSYTFNIESIGQLEPLEIFIKAVEILKNKINAV